MAESQIDPTTKEGILCRSLMQFFRDPENVKTIVPILTEMSPVSLRVLDWFVTNFCKDHTKLIVKDPIMKDLNVYSSYKSQLKAFNKKLFDPFCRLHSNVRKFRFYYDQDRYIVTTTGQLNFFKWAIESHVIEYINKYHEGIKADLKTKEAQKKRARASITESPSSESSPLQLPTLRKAYVIRFD